MSDRYWLLTWTTYGSWLPGDRRGSASSVRQADGSRRRMNTPGTPAAPPQPPLESLARSSLCQPPVFLDVLQARTVISELQDCASYRKWALLAAAVMSNHVHLVVGVPGDPDPSTLLRDFKRRSSRALNERFGRRTDGRWWTQSGSRRRLQRDENVIAAVRYVRAQARPLAVWTSQDVLDG